MISFSLFAEEYSSLSLCLESWRVDDGDVGPRAEPPAGAEGGHLGLGPEPVADLEGELLADLLVDEGGEVVVPDEGVGQGGLAHALHMAEDNII